MADKEKPRPLPSAAKSSSGIALGGVLQGANEMRVDAACQFSGVVIEGVAVKFGLIADCVAAMHAWYRCLLADCGAVLVLAWLRARSELVARLGVHNPTHHILLIFKQPVARCFIAADINIIAQLKSRFFLSIKHQWVSGIFAPQSLKKIISNHAFCLIGAMAIVMAPAAAKPQHDPAQRYFGSLPTASDIRRAQLQRAYCQAALARAELAAARGRWTDDRRCW